jgi:hypothetical protein
MPAHCIAGHPRGGARPDAQNLPARAKISQNLILRSKRNFAKKIKNIKKTKRVSASFLFFI